MGRFVDLRFAVCIPATAGKEHTFILKSNVIDNSKAIIGNGLFECPEKIICRSHQQGAVPNGIPLIPAKRRVVIWFRNTVKTLCKRLNTR